MSTTIRPWHRFKYFRLLRRAPTAILSLSALLAGAPAQGSELCRSAIHALLGLPGQHSSILTDHSNALNAFLSPAPSFDHRSVLADLTPYDGRLPLPVGAVQLATGGFARVYEGPLAIPDQCVVANAIIKVNNPNNISPDFAYLMAAREYLSLLDLKNSVTDPNEPLHFPAPIAVGWMNNPSDQGAVAGLAMQAIANPLPMNTLIYGSLGNPLGPQNVMAIAIDGAVALEQIHRVRIHGDIKPANILISGMINNPRVTLIDFGTSSVEGSFLLFTTIAYTSPLAAANDRIVMRPHLDIYSFSRSLEEMALRGNLSETWDHYPKIPVAYNNRVTMVPFSERSVYSILAERPNVPLADREAARLYSPYLYFCEMFDTAAAMRGAFTQLAQVGTDPLRKQEFLDNLQANIVRLFQAATPRGKIDLAGKIITSSEILQWIMAPAGQPRLTFQPIAAELAALMRRFTGTQLMITDYIIAVNERYPSRLPNNVIIDAANRLSPPP